MGELEARALRPISAARSASVGASVGGSLSTVVGKGEEPWKVRGHEGEWSGEVRSTGVPLWGLLSGCGTLLWGCIM